MTCPVSVIIPCFNSADTLERAVESVAGQVALPVEIILIDDCSTDDGKTLNAISFLQKKFNTAFVVRVISLKENRGPGGARNAGWVAATQPYLAFLDADDSWHPKKLEIQYSWMKNHPDVMLTGHKSKSIERGEIFPAIDENMDVHQISARQLLFKNYFPTRTAMLKSECKYRFDDTKRYAEDYLLWMEVVLSGEPAWRLEIPLAYSYKLEFGEKGLTSNLFAMEKGELDAFYKIFSLGLIPMLLYNLVVFFSFAKFAKRLFIVSVRRIMGIFGRNA